MITNATPMTVMAPTANSPPTVPNTANCDVEPTTITADVVTSVSVDLRITEADVDIYIPVSDELETNDDSGVFDVKPVMVCCMCIIHKIPYHNNVSHKHNLPCMPLLIFLSSLRLL